MKNLQSRMKHNNFYCAWITESARRRLSNRGRAS